MKKFLYIITLLVSVVFICSGDDSRLQKLKIGVPQFTPFAFRGSNGKITGLAIDELNLWSRKTGVKVLYVLLRSDNLANSIKSGKVDAALVAGNNIGNGMSLLIIK